MSLIEQSSININNITSHLLLLEMMRPNISISILNTFISLTQYFKQPNICSYSLNQFFKKADSLDVLVHTCNPNSREAEAEELL